MGGTDWKARPAQEQNCWRFTQVGSRLQHNQPSPPRGQNAVYYVLKYLGE
jgi:hypothetical protein